MKKKYHHGDLKQALVEAASDAINQFGAEKLSLRSLAASIGVSHPAVYRHFSNRDDLLAEVAAQAYCSLLQRIEHLIQASSDFHETLLQFGMAYLALCREKPGLSEIMFGYDFMELYEKRSLGEHADSVFHTFQRWIEEGQQQGYIRSAPSETLTLLFWSLIHGFSQLYSRGRLGDKITSEEQARLLAQQLLQLVFLGMAPEPIHSLGSTP